MAQHPPYQVSESIEHFWGGLFHPSKSGDTLAVENPAQGKQLAKVCRGSSAEVECAVQAAREAFPQWSGASLEERAHALEKLADRIDQHREELATLEALNTGKPYKLALNLDIARSAENLRFFARAPQARDDEAHWMQKGGMQGSPALNVTQRTSLGVVGLISPWNLPLYLLTWKIAPALITGNTVVAKPSEITPVTAHKLAQLSQGILPAGVLNMVHGLGAEAGEALVTHPVVKAISFTGGTASGRVINERASSQMKKVSLELGGKNPTVVFEDADLEAAVSATAKSAFLNQGQICLCGSRILIQKNIYPQFVKALKARVESMKVGDPFGPDTQLGAITHRAHYHKIIETLKEARELGATAVTGGLEQALALKENRELPGHFIPATLLEGVPMEHALNQEEIFGPVATLTAFDTVEEGIALANQSPYGLAANIWTQNLSTAQKASAAIDCGIVWVNCWCVRDLRTPFGGMKQSGLGREGGRYALEFFTKPKNICFEWSNL